MMACIRFLINQAILTDSHVTGQFMDEQLHFTWLLFYVENNIYKTQWKPLSLLFKEKLSSVLLYYLFLNWTLPLLQNHLCVIWNLFNIDKPPLNPAAPPPLPPPTIYYYCITLVYEQLVNRIELLIG